MRGSDDLGPVGPLAAPSVPSPSLDTGSATPSGAAPRAVFGDIVENGWASENNPTRTGYFVRKGHRTGRINAGQYWEITNGNGKFWELSPVGEHKITVRSGARIESAELQGAEAEIKRLRAALKPFADLGVGWGPDDEHDPRPYRILRGAIRQARRALSNEGVATKVPSDGEVRDAHSAPNDRTQDHPPGGQSHEG